jgi:predicted short-subunit dehydrogenase-like oxidoreductase (DUF2520 family)
MGQVPHRAKIPALPGHYGIVGDGRLARHLAHYFTLSGVPFRQWSRRAAEGRLPEEMLADCTRIIVAISDGAIEPFVRDARARAPEWAAARGWVHCSGALSTDLAWGMHPLSTFAGELFDLATYRHIPFICDREAPDFREVFPALINPAYRLRRADRPRYHALCVLAGNFTTLLWQKLAHDFERDLGLPFDAARPYLAQVAINLARDPDGALTGPLARGDRATIARHRAVLDGDPFRAVYEAFVRATRPDLLVPEPKPEAQP